MCKFAYTLLGFTDMLELHGPGAKKPHLVPISCISPSSLAWSHAFYHIRTHCVMEWIVQWLCVSFYAHTPIHVPAHTHLSVCPLVQQSLAEHTLCVALFLYQWNLRDLTGAMDGCGPGCLSGGSGVQDPGMRYKDRALRS